MISFEDNNEKIFSALREIIMCVTHCSDCIEANPNALAPKGTYATIQVVSQTVGNNAAQVLQSEIDEETGDMLKCIEYPATWEVTVNFWRKGSVKMANAMQNLHYVSNVQYILKKNKIGIWKTSPVTNLTALQSSNYEERAVITLTIVGTMKICDRVGFIKSTSFSVEDRKARELARVEVSRR